MIIMVMVMIMVVRMTMVVITIVVMITIMVLLTIMVTGYTSSSGSTAEALPAAYPVSSPAVIVSTAPPVYSTLPPVFGPEVALSLDPQPPYPSSHRPDAPRPLAPPSPPNATGRRPP